MQIVNKKIKLKLVGIDGNAFSIMGAFANQARKEKWTKAEIDSVLEECMKDSYDHLLCVVMAHCEDPT
jgi:hypothetical protein